MAAERTWLDVGYPEKDQAKAAGARWDPMARRWYAPPGHEAALERWKAAPDVPDLLPGEDRSLGQGLFVDLVPSSCWFTNVRSCVSPRDWKRLRRMITARAGQRCEVCGAKEDRKKKRWLEAHERWEYDDARRTQKLGRLISLCTDCHNATHFGFAQLRGLGEEALRHLMRVTGMTERQAREHVHRAFQTWEARSRRDYDLDLSMLTDAGITLAPPPHASARAGVATEKLRIEGVPQGQRGSA
ncbi:DUF5710 domain-containing protein [Streptomyces sp. V3I7]|uniref:DUF5710 domain-containing protein n=1 Tax=Streptomyces sp. V3I7 TaxID=3042278 RepID=UPI00278572F4|nr:DUF5710 domain-containing protein [Streptomyces sp. V3I7]MDQ0991892.1 hypothetical protein [Streptomyces sp. V3I7]